MGRAVNAESMAGGGSQLLSRGSYRRKGAHEFRMQRGAACLIDAESNNRL